MAQVDRAAREDIDQLLSHAFAAWESLADVQRDIGGWELEDQLSFVEEWPLEEDRLQRLAILAQTGEMSKTQRAKYHGLVALVDQRRPLVDQLLRG